MDQYMIREDKKGIRKFQKLFVLKEVFILCAQNEKLKEIESHVANNLLAAIETSSLSEVSEFM